MLKNLVILFFYFFLLPGSYADLIAYYSFNQGSGNKLIEDTKKYNAGEIHNAKWVHGKYGFALEFDGENSFVRIPGSSKTSEKMFWDGPLTISCWMKNFTAGRISVFISKQRWLGVNKYSRLIMMGMEKTKGKNKWINGNSTLDANTWHHIGICFNKGSLSLYVDGQLDKEENDPSWTPGWYGDLILGSGNDNYMPFVGILDEVKIFDRCLNEKEIKDQMKEGCNIALDANSRIIISEHPNLVADYAAKELQHYIHEVCGNEIQIVTDKTDICEIKGLKILVGASKYTEKLGLNLSTLAKEGFVIKKEADYLILAGRDSEINRDPVAYRQNYNETGTLSSVYAFLEEYIGVRWLWPGKSGEVLPTTDRIELPEKIDIIQEPSFKLRDFAYHMAPHTDQKSKNEMGIWARRNKLGRGGLRGHPSFGYAGHAYYELLEGNKYFDSHPEYYSMVGGKRIKKEYQRGQLCTSNPDVLKICADGLRAWIEKNPEEDVFPAGPDDGWEFCECKNCRAIDRPELYEKGDGAHGLILSDRIFKFTNELAHEIKKTHPGKYLGILAYTFYHTPPKTMSKIEDNIFIEYTWNCRYNIIPEKRDIYLRDMKGWHELVDNRISRYEYYGEYLINLPDIHVNEIAQDLCFLKENSSIGISKSEINRDWSINGINYYVASKLLWNGKLKTKDIINDYCEKGFGKAASEMEQYFAKLEELCRVATLKKKDFIQDMVSVLDDEQLKQLKSYLDTALQKAEKKEELKRIEFIRSGYQYVSISSRLFRIYQRLENAGYKFFPFTAQKKEVLDKDTLKALINEAYILAKEREEFITRHKNEPVLDMYTLAVNGVGGHYKSIESLYKLYEADQKTELPLKWKFKADVKNSGNKEGFQIPDYDDSAWQFMSVSDFWEKQGYGDADGYKGNYPGEGYNGIGWYRMRTGIPLEMKGRKVILTIGAVDESCWIYINGSYAGEFIYDAKKNMNSWQEPQNFDISNLVKFGEENLIAIKVEDKAGSGGIWKPCAILYSN